MNESIQELLEELEPFDRILVTGPARSGTTIIAQVIAKELKRKYIDEHDVADDGNVWPEDLQKALKINENLLKVVIQSPSISYWVHNLKDMEDLAVVFCIRKLEEIYNSQVRWQWLATPDFIRMVEKYKAMPELEEHIDYNSNPAKMALMAWYNFQQYELNGIAFEFWYKWLEDTDYFVPYNKRQIWLGWGFKSVKSLLPPMKPEE